MSHHIESRQTVLAEERRQLCNINDVADLRRWSGRLITELASPGSPYAHAMDRVEVTPYEMFLGQWSQLLEHTMARLQTAGTIGQDRSAHQLATTIMAAVRGGLLLAQTACDERPLRNALRLALDQLAVPDRC